MPTVKRLIAKQTLLASTTSVTFSNIPQTYTDLRVVISARGDHSSYVALGVQYNGSSANQTGRSVAGSASASSGTDQNNTFTNVITYARLSGFYIPTQAQTANTFSNLEWNIANYAGSASKASLLQFVCESNSTSPSVTAIEQAAVLWSNSSPLTSLTFGLSAANFVAGSTFYLYAITQVPVIVGGTERIADGYKYHTFTSTSSLRVIEGGVVEYLVVASGGGGGGWTYGGGGGGGGLLNGRAGISLGNHTVTIGSGGAGSDSASGSSGNASSVAGLSAVGGGGGGGIGPTSGLSGGSGGGGGGGGGSASSQTNGGAGTAGQGSNGGGSYSESQRGAGGGGGGAGAVGGNASQNLGGNGGAGRLVWGNHYAGGGGGATYNDFASTPGNGGVGGGGIGGRNAVLPAGSGVANTGGGGGGRGTTIGNGGSGIVIIRYPHIGN
jgi:hypothetical protein